MAKKTSTKVEKNVEKKLLSMDMSIADGQKLLDSGDVTAAQFSEWVLAKAKMQEKSGNGKPAGKGRRDECEVTRAEFTKFAKNIKIVIDGTEYEAAVKNFKAKLDTEYGSFGWMLMGPAQIKLTNGKLVTVQLSINLPVRNSKFQKD